MQLSVICMTVRLGWTTPYICLLFVWQQGLGGLTVMQLSVICMTLRLEWTDCHMFVSYLNDSKAWVDWTAIHLSLIFRFLKFLPFHVCLAYISKIYDRCITNFDTCSFSLYNLMLNFLGNEVKFMVISSNLLTKLPLSNYKRPFRGVINGEAAVSQQLYWYWQWNKTPKFTTIYNKELNCIITIYNKELNCITSISWIYRDTDQRAKR